jgi:hypothetical protein
MVKLEVHRVRQGLTDPESRFFGDHRALRVTAGFGVPAVWNSCENYSNVHRMYQASGFEQLRLI